MNDPKQLVDVADVQDVPAGNMKHVEVAEEEILIANSEGKVYALCDRCSHMNGPLYGNSKWKCCNLPHARCQI